MAIIAADNGKKYPLVPAGTHNAVCVDVVDEGLKETTFEGKTTINHKISIWWQIDEERPDVAGERFTVRKWYTLSLHKKANLSKELEAWRGKPFTEEERKGFDIETLIGVPAMVSVVHKPSADGSKTYANVTTISNLPKGMPKLQAHGYKRKKDREGAKYDESIREDMEAQQVEVLGEDGEPIPF